MSCVGMWIPRATMFTDMTSAWWVCLSLLRSILALRLSTELCIISLPEPRGERSLNVVTLPRILLETVTPLCNVFGSYVFHCLGFFYRSSVFVCFFLLFPSSVILPLSVRRPLFSISLPHLVATLPSWCSSSWSWCWRRWAVTRPSWGEQGNTNWRSARGRAAAAASACRMWPSHGKHVQSGVFVINSCESTRACVGFDGGRNDGSSHDESESGILNSCSSLAEEFI